MTAWFCQRYEGMRSGQPVKECAFSRKRQKRRRQNLMKKQDSIQVVTKESKGACTLPPFFSTRREMKTSFSLSVSWLYRDRTGFRVRKPGVQFWLCYSLWTSAKKKGLFWMIYRVSSNLNCL